MASKRHIIMFGLGLQLAALAAQADIYRCEQDGRTVYTDHPCAGERIDPELATRAGAGDPAAQASRDRHESAAKIETTRRWQHEDAAADAQQRKADAEWLANYAKEKQIEDAFQRREVVAGMTQDQVRLILGTPDRIGKESSDRGQDELWEYPDRGTGRATASFRNGKLLKYRSYGKRRR